MSHEVIWTKRVTDFFEDAANLTRFEREILESRISGMTRVQQSLYFSVSLSTIDKTIARLKKIYDEVQQEYPDELRPRRASIYESYQDHH